MLGLAALTFIPVVSLLFNLGIVLAQPSKQPGVLYYFFIPVFGSYFALAAWWFLKPQSTPIAVKIIVVVAEIVALVQLVLMVLYCC